MLQCEHVDNFTILLVVHLRLITKLCFPHLGTSLQPVICGNVPPMISRQYKVNMTHLNDACLQVENFLMHFWQGIPTHLLPVLATSLVVDLVAFCDSLLYGVIRDVLIVSPLQSCPERFVNEPFCSSITN